jgi:hypothetical protein
MSFKKIILFLSSILIGLSILAPGPGMADTIIYGANAYGDMDMIEINPIEETAQYAGSIDFGTQAIARDPETGNVYYFEWQTSGDQFAYWNPQTGDNVIVKTYDSPPGGAAKGMDFAPDGTLYILGNADGFASIDKNTGEIIMLGKITGATMGSLGRTGDIAFAPDGTLYLATYQSLYTININTLQATLLYSNMISSSQPIVVWSGLGYCNGILYGSIIEADSPDDPNMHSTIYSIDPATGVVTELFPSPVYLNDLTSCINPILNHTPVFDPIEAQSVTEGQLLEFVVTASDPDSGDTLVFSADNLPAGADFDPQTQTFSWIPGDGDAGNYTVTFTVTDDGIPPRSASEEVSITVNSSSTSTLELSGASVTEDTVIASGSYALLNYGGSTNMFTAGRSSSGVTTRALIRWDFSSIPPGSTIVSAQMSLYSNYSYGGSIVINAHRVLKPWVEGTLNGQQRQLDNPDSACWNEYGYGTPWDAAGANGAGDRETTVISSANGSGTGWYAWDIREAVQKWVDGEWDNDGLILKAQNESSTNLKYFVPSENQQAALRPQLVVEYEQSTALNHAPVFDPIEAQSVTEGQLLEFVVTASDPDSGDTLVFSADNLPVGADFDPQTQTFSWITGDGDAGDYTVTFTVTDDGIPPRSASEEVSITVNSSTAPNHAPIFDPIEAQSVTEGQLLEFVVTASDPDSGDTLVFSADNLPVGADFDPQTQTFSWITGDGDAGDYTVTFTVTDDGIPPRSASEEVSITVNSSSASTLELSGASVTEDTVIASGSYLLLNYGGSTNMFAAGRGLSGVVTRALIRWDLSAIPPGSTIVSAQMSLYSNYSYGGSIVIDTHRVLKPWVEGTLNGQQRQLDNPDSACGTEYGYGILWDAAGASGVGDRETTVISSANGSGTGWYAWDIKEAVQKWVDGEWDNDGLLLKAQNESSTNLKYFNPSESQQAALRPQLVIDYVQP